MRRRDHRARSGNAAALLQLHVDAVARAHQARHVARADGRFVGHDRERRCRAHPAEALDVLGINRLLDEFEVERHEGGDARRRVGGGPGGVRIDADRSREALADRPERGDVVAVAELDLEHGEAIGRGLRGALGHDLWLGDPDREGGGRRLAGGEPQKIAQRDAGLL